MPVDGNLLIPIVQSAGVVVIILDHAADRNIQPQIRQHLLCHMHLTFTAIHHDHIRKDRESIAALFSLL